MMERVEEASFLRCPQFPVTASPPSKIGWSRRLIHNPLSLSCPISVYRPRELSEQTVRSVGVVLGRACHPSGERQRECLRCGLTCLPSNAIAAAAWHSLAYYERHGCQPSVCGANMSITSTSNTRSEDPQPKPRQTPLMAAPRLEVPSKALIPFEWPEQINTQRRRTARRDSRLIISQTRRIQRSIWLSLDKIRSEWN